MTKINSHASLIKANPTPYLEPPFDRPLCPLGINGCDEQLSGCCPVQYPGSRQSIGEQDSVGTQWPWSNLLQDLPLSPEQSDLQAAGKWKNGSNKGWKNSGGGSKWKNGSGSSWNKSGRVAPVRNNWGNGGWRNNYYGGSFVNW